MKRKIFARRNILWIVGFGVLLLVDVIVESFLLPAFGLDHTEKNDIYFKIWWIVVGIWLFFGRDFLKFTENKSNHIS